jgi:hypothetical protein
MPRTADDVRQIRDICSFTFTSKSDGKGRRKSEGESEAEGVDPGHEVQVPVTMLGLWGACPDRTTDSPFSLPWLGHAATVGCSGTLPLARWSTTDFFRPTQGQTAPVPWRRLLGHWTELSLGPQREQGTPSALTSRKWPSLLPEDIQVDESESERRVNQLLSFPSPSVLEGKGIFFFTFERHCGSVFKVFTTKNYIKKSLVSTGVFPRDVYRLLFAAQL